MSRNISSLILLLCIGISAISLFVMFRKDSASLTSSWMRDQQNDISLLIDPFKWTSFRETGEAEEEKKKKKNTYLTHVRCCKIINGSNPTMYLWSYLSGTALRAWENSAAKPIFWVICKLDSLLIRAKFHYWHDWSKCLDVIQLHMNLVSSC